MACFWGCNFSGEKWNRNLQCLPVLAVASFADSVCKVVRSNMKRLVWGKGCPQTHSILENNKKQTQDSPLLAPTSELMRVKHHG
jgi:hypothetical protein